ncbi:MAG: ADP-ribosylglycohydrolase family protein [Thermoleophilaceae bacterium]
MAARIDKDRSLGALLGLAAGDALGAPVEGLPAGEIRERHGTLSEMTGGGHLGLRAGQGTDDTEMAICLARSLISSGGFDARAALAEYLAWYRGEPLGIGLTVAGVLERVEGGAAPHDAVREQHEASGGLSGGNGALMRTTPIAIAFAGNDRGLRDATLEDAAITHYDPLAGKAALLHNQVISWVLTRGPDAPLAELRDASWLDERIEDVVVPATAGLREQAESRAADDGAFVLASLAVGLAAYFSAESFEEGLVWAVNAGGDTDTNGAVAGALLGARFGAAAIPDRWLTALERRADLETLHGHLAKLA